MKKLLMITALSFIGFSAHAYPTETHVSDSQCVQNGLNAAAAKGHTDLSLVSLEKITGDGRSVIHGYRIWFKKADTRGYIVANADSFCNVFQVYKHW